MELLERTIRRWRRIVYTMAVLAVATVGIGAAQMNEDELVRRQLVLQNEKGCDRIDLAADKHAGVTRLFGTTTRIGRCGSLPNGKASIEHYDAGGERRITSVTMPDGEAFTA